jgi:hypothetical protein
MARPAYVARPVNVDTFRTNHHREATMQYLPLFLLFLAALIAAYFYLQRAKARPTDTSSASTDASTPSTPSVPTDRSAE